MIFVRLSRYLLRFCVHLMCKTSRVPLKLHILSCNLLIRLINLVLEPEHSKALLSKAVFSQDVGPVHYTLLSRNLCP